MRFGAISQTEDIEVEIDTEDLGVEGTVPVEEGDSGFRCREVDSGPKIVVAQTGDDIPMIARQR